MAVSVSFLIILIAVVGSAFISASEAAVLAANRFRVRHLAEGGDGRAGTLLRITDEHDRFFGTLLLIGNLFNILISTVGTSLAISLWGNTGGVVAGATLVMTVVVVIGGELTPKSLATVAAERWALLVSRVIWALMTVAGPLVWIFTLAPRGIVKLMGGREAMMTPMVTPGELRMLIDLGEAEGTVEENQGKMLENIFRFAETEARHVMTPRNDILAVAESSTVGEFLEVYAGVPYSRFPVYRDDLDDIVGVLGAKDVLRALADGSIRREDPVSELARPALFIPETNKLDDLFDTMRQTGHKMAMAVDEYGGVAGLVTLSRVVEEAVGRIGEEGVEPGERYVSVGEDAYEIDAGMSVAEANERLRLNLPGGDYQTVAGLILEHLQRMPRVGDRVRQGNIRLQVTAMDGRKIARVRARRRNVRSADGSTTARGQTGSGSKP